MSNTEKNTPSHIVYQVQEGKEDRSYWRRIGAAWSHGDGKGMNIQLNALPIDGKITVRVYSPAEDAAE